MLFFIYNRLYDSCILNHLLAPGHQKVECFQAKCAKSVSKSCCTKHYKAVTWRPRCMDRVQSPVCSTHMSDHSLKTFSFFTECRIMKLDDIWACPTWKSRYHKVSIFHRGVHIFTVAAGSNGWWFRCLDTAGADGN